MLDVVSDLIVREERVEAPVRGLEDSERRNSPIGRHLGGSINVDTEKRISCVLRCGCRGCCRSVGGRDVGCDAICHPLRGAARRASRGATPHSTARRSPGTRSAHKPSGSRAGGEQCPASAPRPPYVWVRDRGDVRICNQRRAKPHSQSRRYILRAAYRGSLNISESKRRQTDKNSGLHGCRPKEPEHGCRIDCIDGSQRKAQAPIVSISPNIATGRKLAVVCGRRIIVVAGVPFGTPPAPPTWCASHWSDRRPREAEERARG